MNHCYHHFDDGKRKVTFCYWYDQEEQILRFGWSRFKMPMKSTEEIKKDIKKNKNILSNEIIRVAKISGWSNETIHDIWDEISYGETLSKEWADKINPYLIENYQSDKLCFYSKKIGMRLAFKMFNENPITIPIELDTTGLVDTSQTYNMLRDLMTCNLKRKTVPSEDWLEKFSETFKELKYEVEDEVELEDEVEVEDEVDNTLSIGRPCYLITYFALAMIAFYQVCNQ